MKDKELRKLIGSRAKQRRTELNLTQPYIAEKMGVTASTIQRYEAGTIDNTKKMVLEGLSEALHVSVEWLRGETDEYETDITDKRELQIRDAMTDILKQYRFRDCVLADRGYCYGNFIHYNGIPDNWDWLSGGKNLPEILLGYHQHYGGNNEYSYRNLLWRMDKICHSDKPHCTVTTCICGLYWNSMLCKRLARRAGILLRKTGERIAVNSVVAMLYHANRNIRLS